MGVSSQFHPLLAHADESGGIHGGSLPPSSGALAKVHQMGRISHEVINYAPVEFYCC